MSAIPVESLAELSPILLKFIEPFTILVSVLGVLLSVLGAFKSGVLKKIVIGKISLEGTQRDHTEQSGLPDVLNGQRDDNVPFETGQLSNYYTQVLAQSKVSFWFSIVFASLGFLVIIAAALLYSQERTGSTIASFSAGAIIDSVSALFFVQSKSAQRAMGEFFDKLRKDRQQAESRAMCESIQDAKIRDVLRVQLALYYAGIDDHKSISAAIIASCNCNMGTGS
jgi:hypothetical protein